MSELFIVRNHHDFYLGKQGEWVDGSDPRALLRTKHRDEAVNSCFEVSSKDPLLRARVESCEADKQGLPVVDIVPGLEKPAPQPDIDTESFAAAKAAAEPVLEES